MKNQYPVARSAFLKTALFLFGATLAVSTAQVFAAPAPETVLRPLADKAMSLPVKTSFVKVKAGENGGQYALKVTNTSKESLKLTVAVIESVTTHSHPKNRTIPEHTLKAGEELSVDDLAVGDKVTLSAVGFEPLALTVK